MNRSMHGFIAGFLATLLFHQGLLALLHWLANAPAPFDMSGAPPLGVPRVLSLAFWGGVWGVGLAWLLKNQSGARYWWAWILSGAVGPSAVAMLVVFPLKGLPVTAQVVVGALLLNAAWGLGCALYLRMVAKTR